MDIYLDFEGTVVEPSYGKMGRCNFGCIEIIKKLQDAGHNIMLNTSRVEKKESLDEALRLLNENYYMFIKDRSMRNDFKMQPISAIKEKISPDRFDWERIKENNVIFIDDNALDMPLKKAVMTSGMIVDWDELDRQFKQNGIYDKLIK